MPNVSEPKLPANAVPSVPNVPAPCTAPVRITVTLLLAPASTSVSLVITLPVGFVPAVALAVPPDSSALAVSLTPTGASFTLLSVTATACTTELSAPSLALTVMS